MKFERNLCDVAPDVDLAHDGDVLQINDVESEQFGHNVQDLVVGVDERAFFTVDVLELDVAQPEDGREHAEDAVAHLRLNLQHVEGEAERVKATRVVHAVDAGAARLVQVVVGVGAAQLELLRQIFAVLWNARQGQS